MNVSSLYVAASGLAANSAKAAVSAHNIANVNTDGYKKSRAVIESNPAGQPEVKVSESNAAGPVVQEPEGLPGGKRTRELSNVDFAEEFIQTTMAGYGYRANASIVRVQDEMVGTILDILV